MWDNDDWAKAHIKKKHPNVTTTEAWEVVFNSGAAVLVSPDQLRYPPYKRYWMIGDTKNGKKLLVVWERWRETLNLITAFPPSPEQVRTYESKIKKRN